MIKNIPPSQNKYLQPVNSPADTATPQQKYVPWEWGVRQGVQLKKIRSSTGYFKKLSAGVVGSITSITGGTITTSTFNSGTITNSNFQGTLSQPVSTGGTFTNPTINAGTVSTSLSGGTLNPTIYQANGVAGTSGSIVYVKTVNFAGSTTTLGTLNFSRGIITSFN